MKMLWICPRFPLPANDGARKATMALLSKIQSAGQAQYGPDFSLDIACFFDEPPNASDISNLKSLSGATEVMLIQKDSMKLGGGKAIRRLGFRLRHWNTPLTLAPFSDFDSHQEFVDWSSRRQWDHTVLDGLHAMQLIAGVPPRFGKIIYRAHNVESRLWEQAVAQASNPVVKLILKREYRLFQNYERMVCQRAALTAPVSEIDAAFFERDFSAKRVHAIPIGQDCPEAPMPFATVSRAGAKDENVLRLLFVGKLDWHPNREGLRWFLDSVWPRLTSQTTRRYELKIIGSGDSSWLDAHLPTSNSTSVRDARSANFKNALSSAAGHPLTLIRNAPDLVAHYQESHLTLIPLFMGSGTRVKAIESGGMARTFLSTRVGVEGLPFVSPTEYRQAESADEWVEFLSRVTLAEAEQMGRRAWQSTHRHFDSARLARELITFLPRLSPASIGRETVRAQAPADEISESPPHR